MSWSISRGLPAVAPDTRCNNASEGRTPVVASRSANTPSSSSPSSCSDRLTLSWARRVSRRRERSDPILGRPVTTSITGTWRNTPSCSSVAANVRRERHGRGDRTIACPRGRAAPAGRWLRPSTRQRSASTTAASRGTVLVGRRECRCLGQRPNIDAQRIEHWGEARPTGSGNPRTPPREGSNATGNALRR